MENFVRLDELPKSLVRELLDETREIKDDPPTDEPLRRATLGTVYQKRSTRTRVSFEAGMNRLGGDAVFLSADDIQLGRGETIGDTARALSRYVDGLMARVHGHDEIEALAEHADVPVIDGLSDFNHPCQALADAFTLEEAKGSLDGLHVTWLGDGNNVCHSLLHILPRFGADVTVGTPDDHRPDADVVETARGFADESGATVTLTDDAREAVEGADAVYTDTWVSMGEEGKDASAFEPFQANTDLLSRADDEHIFMHCLPAHRGHEVTDEVIDGPHSVVWTQAENRMHAQMSLLIRLFARNN
ncbi:MAG: ornithine carbamoyltransferase [Halobacteriales archaeon]|nr:ornithine carbamoyltransferase [Halobacteriales archaeon]